MWRPFDRLRFQFALRPHDFKERLDLHQSPPAAFYNGRNTVGARDISGSLVAMFLYDVCDEIRLDELRGILKVPPPGREPPFRQPAPAYVAFARPPIVEAIEPIVLPGGARVDGRVAYFDYGVVSLNLELPFSGAWEEIADRVSRWMNDEQLERKALELAQAYIRKARPALVVESPEKLTED